MIKELIYKNILTKIKKLRSNIKFTQNIINELNNLYKLGIYDRLMVGDKYIFKMIRDMSFIVKPDKIIFSTKWDNNPEFIGITYQNGDEYYYEVEFKENDPKLQDKLKKILYILDNTKIELRI